MGVSADTAEELGVVFQHRGVSSWNARGTEYRALRDDIERCYWPALFGARIAMSSTGPRIVRHLFSTPFATPFPASFYTSKAFRPRIRPAV
jgi:hypothetical protein